MLGRVDGGSFMLGREDGGVFMLGISGEGHATVAADACPVMRETQTHERRRCAMNRKEREF